MTWSCKWGDRYESGFYDSLVAKGALSEDDIMPDVSLFAFYVEAYQELGTCRDIGMGLGPIPFTAIIDYARVYDITGEEFLDFHYIIRKMDRAQLEWESRRQKADGLKANKRNHNKGNRNSGNRPK